MRPPKMFIITVIRYLTVNIYVITYHLGPQIKQFSVRYNYDR